LLPQAGGHPMWSPKGDELFTGFSPTVSHATPLVTAPRFAFGSSVEVPRGARTEASPQIGRRQVDMLPEGRIIGVIAQGGDPTTSQEIVVVLNWLDEVRQRVPRP
jgi:hypothetical protein